MSRLLVLQTKRLMLNSIQRRLARSESESVRERAEGLARETQQAQFRYRKAILDYGSPASSDYWLVAYGRLIEAGGALRSKLRSALGDLPADDRYEVSTDIEALDAILDGWNVSMRTAMSARVTGVA